MTKKVELETTLKITGADAGALLLLRHVMPCILYVRIAVERNS
jgi:hypothetical protein